jgi:hypothetical protein
MRSIQAVAGSRVASWFIGTAVVVVGLFYRLYGIGRSLWIDEAWVANSVLADSWAGMFRYDAWLQTSPPLFLAMVRLTVRMFGLSNASLRVVPFLFSVLSAGVMWVLCRRVLSARFAVPAWALFVLSPLSITFSKTLKQFSAETAVTAAVLLVGVLYVERPTRTRFGLILATVAIGPLLAYSVVFSLPGIVVLVFVVGTERFWRAAIAAAVAGGMSVAVFVLQVLPNRSPSLNAYWANDSGGWIANAYSLVYQLPVPRPVLDNSLFGVGIGVLVCAGMVLGWRKRVWTLALCGLPVVLLVICGTLSLYPMNERLGLFVLPCVVLICGISAELFGVTETVLVCGTLLAIAGSVAKQPLAAQNVPLEDMDSAMRFLRANVRGGDAVFVHASVSEDFKLYARMDGWSGDPARFGNTGWPCCPRGIAAEKGSSREADVRADIGRAVRDKFEGRVWLVYTTRREHWAFAGMDESRVLNDVFRERGCVGKQVPSFSGIGVSEFECSAKE